MLFFENLEKFFLKSLAVRKKDVLLHPQTERGGRAGREAGVGARRKPGREPLRRTRNGEFIDTLRQKQATEAIARSKRVDRTGREAVSGRTSERESRRQTDER